IAKHCPRNWRGCRTVGPYDIEGDPSRQMQIGLEPNQLSSCDIDVTHGWNELEGMTAARSGLEIPSGNPGSRRSRRPWWTATAAHADQNGELANHDVVRGRQGHEGVWFGHKITDAGGGLALDQHHTRATVRNRSSDTRSVRGAVAHRGWRIRDRTRMLVGTTPGRFATDQHRCRASAEQWRSVYG